MFCVKIKLILITFSSISSIRALSIPTNISLGPPVETLADTTTHDIHNASRDAVRERHSQLMKSFMNESVDPCEDFYEYACGNWEKHNPIPSDKWKYSTIHILQENLLNNLRELLSQPITDSQSPSAKDKAKMFYKYCMDEDDVGGRGVQSLLKFIKELGGWPVLDENWDEDEFDWVQLAINTSFVGNGIIIAFDVGKNPKVPKEYSIFLHQTSLGLNNRDNYVKKENKKNLEAYRIFVEKVLRLLDVNEENAQLVSEDIVNFEVKLANATLPMEATKTELHYQPNVTVLQRAYAYIDWKKYLSGIQGTEVSMNQTVVMQLGVKYYENLYHLLIKTEKVTLANYMIWRCVLFFIMSLDNRFRSTLDDLTSAVTGQMTPTPLWKTCVSQVNWNMGMATSSMFIEKYFDETSKNETVQIIDSLKEAFDENLLDLDWIDEDTKSYARKKAQGMRVAAGYPDYIRSEESLNRVYKDVKIVEGKHFENIVNITKHNWRKSRDRLRKPFDRDQWFLPPTIVNALYDSGSNRIIILAALLQPPIFHQHFPYSVNFGAIGMFMGHEVIHGFDDLGRKFNVEGDYLDWWSPEAIKQFTKRQKCFLEQYENFAKRDQTFKSIATLSENLADNGGLRIAHKAYVKWKQENGDAMSEESFANLNLNEDQLFFLSFAQLFCAALRPEALVESRSYEAHSPQKYRILGALMNFEKFSEAYGCPVDSPLNPSNKCRLW